jgi:hypothetical protein
LGFGFVASLGLHFLLYADPTTAWQYLLLDFKMAFLRVGFGFEGFWPRLKLLAFCWPTVALHLLSLALLARAARRRLNPGLSRLCAAVLAASALAYLSILTTDRFILRDLLWVEVLLNLLALVCLLALARFQAFSLAWRGAALGLTGLLVLANLTGAVDIPARLDANYNVYGWSAQRYFRGVYGHNQRRFDKIFSQAYGPDLTPGAVLAGPLGAQALSHAQVRQAMRFIFRNLPLDLRQAGAALPGRPLWLRRPQWRLAQMPQAMRGALLVDASAVAPTRRGFLRPSLVRDHSEELDKGAPAPPDPALALLPRNDLALYLFLEQPFWQRLGGPGLERPALARAPRLKAVGPKGEITLLGMRVELYQEISLADLGPNFIFLVKNPAAAWGGGG